MPILLKSVRCFSLSLVAAIASCDGGGSKPVLESQSAFSGVIPSTSSSASPAVAVDSSGRIHLAFLTTGALAKSIAYSTCAAACSQAGSWTSIGIEASGANPLGTSLVLDSSGHPRILYLRDHGGLGDSYRFLQCNASDCLDQNQWTSVDAAVVSNAGNADGIRSLVLDPQGRPAFLHIETVAGNLGNSPYLARCISGDCTSPNAWTDSPLAIAGTQRSEGPTQLLLWQPGIKLAFDSLGSMYILDRVFDAVAAEPSLVLLGCVSGCDQTANWATTIRFIAGNGGMQALRITSADNLRIAFSNGPAISYLACDGACTNAADWTTSVLPAGTNSGAQGLDLALDAKDRPRIAFTLYGSFIQPNQEGVGAGIAACDSNCERATAWTFTTGEEGTTSPNVKPADGCGLGHWWAGQNARLALAPDGQTVLTYDSAHQAGGRCSGNFDKQLVRVAMP